MNRAAFGHFIQVELRSIVWITSPRLKITARGLGIQTRSLFNVALSKYSLKCHPFYIHFVTFSSRELCIFVVNGDKKYNSN